MSLSACGRHTSSAGPRLSKCCRQAVRAPTTRARPVKAAAAAAAMQDWTIVGSGRVGQALAEMGENDTVVRRGQMVEGPQGPIVVCTRNDALEDVVNATPEERRRDLVFIQNGMLQPWLAERGLEQNTQVLVYFAVPKAGATPEDGKTDANPEGLTAAWGLHAEAVATRLHANNLACKVLEKDAFQRSMLEKLIWISSFMLIGTKHKVNVGEVESKHTDEVAGLMKELGGVGGAELGVQLDDKFVERLLAYARSVASFPTAVKEFYWRNGWFHRITERETAAGKPDPFPTHTALLQEVGAI
ncbi:hypothetical protein WJX74_010188 [Apatococcus lobatus]|uniref:Uncharacterized protein n=1 Tax=Apatococcus lobatus TaxID=904363 RepID=A0AAW1RUP8_9CHLO